MWAPPTRRQHVSVDVKRQRLGRQISGQDSSDQISVEATQYVHRLDAKTLDPIAERDIRSTKTAMLVPGQDDEIVVPIRQVHDHHAEEAFVIRLPY